MISAGVASRASFGAFVVNDRLVLDVEKGRTDDIRAGTAARYNPKSKPVVARRKRVRERGLVLRVIVKGIAARLETDIQR